MDIPQCYGEFWEGIPGSACMECHIKGDCLAKFATGRLVKTQQKLGAQATIDTIAAETGVAVEAIKFAIQFQKNVGMGVAKSEAVPPAPPQQQAGSLMPPPQGGAAVTTPPPPPPLTEKQVATMEPKTSGSLATGEQMATKKKTEKAKKPEPKPKAKAKSEPKPEPKPKAKPEVKKPEPKPKAKSKVKPEVKKVEPSSRPSKAGASAKPAKAPAKPKKGKSATSASVQAGTRTWSQEHDQVRWERERERSPALAQLKPGQTLKREWPPKSGKEVEVRVLLGRYKFQEKEYPTLYSVVKEITGTSESPKQLRGDGTRPEGLRKLAPWSAVKFFKAALTKMGCFKSAEKVLKKRPKKPSPKKTK